MVRFTLILSLIFSSTFAHADVLFEGYSKIMVNGQHSGYVITRYEFDPKKNQFTSSYFLRTGKNTGEITESFKAIAASDLAPISYEYTTIVGKDTKTIDAKFKKDNMSAVVKNNGKVSRIEKKIPKGTFLSTFLVYLMMKSKEGLKSDSKYEYQAIAEEDGSLEKGQALVGKEEHFNGQKAFKILNTFKNSKFLSYVNDHGEVLGTNVMSQGVSTELVATPEEATKGFPVSNAILTTVFGGVPKGDNNVVARSASLPKQDAMVGKKQGVPGGQGIVIKAQPEKADSKEAQ